MTTAAAEHAPAEPAAPPHRPFDSSRWFDVGTGAIVVLQLAVYAMVAIPGSFYLDDLAGTNVAAGSALDWSYLRGPTGHHLSPAARLWVWLQAHLAPLDHTGAVLVCLALQAVVTLALARLLRSLFGPRPLALIPLGLYAFTPLSVPTFAWWVQSVCLLPVLLSIIGATSQHLAYLRTGRLRNAVGAGAWVLLGLLFWEKAVLAVVLPVLLTLVAFTTGPGPRARVVSLLRRWPAWVALGLPPLAFAVVYSQQARESARSTGAGKVLALLWDSTTKMVVPSLLGGPWRWTTKEYYGTARPTGVQVVASGALLLVLVAASLLHRRRAAWRGWLLLLLYVPISLAPVAAGRLAQYGVVIGRDSRYVTDIAVAAAIAVGLVLMPVVTAEPAAAPPARRPWLSRAVVTVAILAFAASTAVSLTHFSRRWHENPNGAYLANLQEDLRALPGSTPLYDGDLPQSVLSSFYAPSNRLSALLAQLPGEARFEDGQVPLQMVRPDGHVRAAHLAPATRSRRGPDGACGDAIRPGAGPVHVPLEHPVFDFVNRTVRVELLLSAPTAVRVETRDGATSRRVGDGQVLPRGPAAVVALAPGGYLDAVDVSVLTPSAAACVLSVTIGQPQPLGHS
ncbi:MAG: hypothetical protein WCD35_04995 [Mycobacteriales bacterium]